MEVVKNSSDSNHIKLTIKLTSPEWEKVLDKASVKASEGAKIPGFREGKAPRTVVINQIGEARVVSVAIELAVEEYYPLAAKQEQIKPIAFPKIAVEQGGLTEPLTFTAEVAVLPEVKLGDYSKIRVKKTVEPVTDEQVDGVIKNMQKRAVEFQPVEREAKLGDWTEIDFDGFVDGKPFEGGSSKKHPLILGDKVFIPGFEEGMVGMRAQEEKDIEVEFPKDYHNKDLAGKPAKFTVKLHQIKAVNYPDINDTFAKKHANVETLEALKADIKKFLDEEAEKKASEKVREDAIMALTKLAKIDLPDELVNQELDNMVQDLKHQAEHAKMTFEDYLKRAGVNEEGLKNQWREQAEQRVLAGLSLEAFREAEKIEAANMEVDEEINRIKAQYPQNADEIDKEYGSARGKARLGQMVGSRKAVEKLVEIATSTSS